MCRRRLIHLNRALVPWLKEGNRAVEVAANDFVHRGRPQQARAVPGRFRTDGVTRAVQALYVDRAREPHDEAGALRSLVDP